MAIFGYVIFDISQEISRLRVNFRNFWICTKTSESQKYSEKIWSKSDMNSRNSSVLLFFVFFCPVTVRNRVKLRKKRDDFNLFRFLTTSVEFPELDMTSTEDTEAGKWNMNVIRSALDSWDIFFNTRWIMSTSHSFNTLILVIRSTYFK